MALAFTSESRSLRTILIVEDHADTRQMYVEFLSGRYDVAEARDAPEALAIIRKSPPDLVITDLSLPGMDGFELIRNIRSEPSTAAIPAICVSGYGGHAHEQRARQVGCDRVLQKPLLPDTLAEAAEELLRTDGDRRES